MGLADIELTGSTKYIIPMGRPKGFERQQVLEKATIIFWQKGFAETSLHDLEKATGVNKSGLYAEFKDKQDFFVACLEHYIQNHQGVALLKREPYGWDNIEDFLALVPRLSTLSGCFCVNTMRETSILPEEARLLVVGYLQNLEQLLVRNLASEGVTAAHALAGVIMTFNSGNCLAQNAENSGPNRERISAFLDLLRQPSTAVTAHTDSW